MPVALPTGHTLCCLEPHMELFLAPIEKIIHWGLCVPQPQDMGIPNCRSTHRSSRQCQHHSHNSSVTILRDWEPSDYKYEGRKLDRVDAVTMSAQSPAEGRHQPCVRGAESWQREQRRTERNNSWYQKRGWVVRIEKTGVEPLCSVQEGWTLRCWSLEQEVEVSAFAKQIHFQSPESSEEILSFHG